MKNAAWWHTLKQHHHQLTQTHLLDLFKANPTRFEDFSAQAVGLFLDYSKNHLTQDTLPLLIDWANAANLAEKIQALMTGKNINITEQRPALHTALRQPANSTLLLDNHNIIPDIQHELNRMRLFTQAVRHQDWRGATGEAITDIINVGIGGSHLGPEMVTAALNKNDTLRCHFISNPDPSNLKDTLTPLNPARTLVILSSKSFKTRETLLNAEALLDWLQPLSLAQHCVAVTAHPERAQAFGLPEENIFKIWPWVGGRYSVWSAIGLPIALSVGFEDFENFLAGAHAMDQHFQTTTFEKNLPVLLALISCWYHEFYGATTHAVMPYAHQLRHLPAYLQQLVMESLGKSCTLSGETTTLATSPILWGTMGCNAQHSFFQLLHQGTSLIPVDFILPINPEAQDSKAQALIQANCLSQSQALMCGNQASGHAAIQGNKPSNTILMPRCDAYHLGALLALYEHKTFVQSCLWDINAFDQFGVELGKSLTEDMLASSSAQAGDGSTRGLMARLKSEIS